MRTSMQLALFALLILSSACLKTTEQIEREKKVDNLSQELSQSHKTVAELMLQVKDLQSKLNSMNGQFEELDHKQSSNMGKQIEEVHKQVTLLQEQVRGVQTENKGLNEKVVQLQENLDSQKAFIEKVTHSLGKMSQVKEEKVEKAKVEETGKTYEDALTLFKEKKIKKAKEIFLNIIDDKSQGAGTINKSHYQLGLIEFKSKKYDEALIHLSKVYTQYPDSSIAPSALLYIGKSFKAMKKDEEANSSFSELMEKYPKAKEATLAKKELK
ncbi:MAG: tetratricopeptide repeat protein [Bacteriovoracaceae bacterium]